MSGWKCFLYVIWSDSSYRVGISHDPMLDLKFYSFKGYREMKIISQALPVGMAYALWEQLADAREKLGKPYVNETLARQRPLVKQAVRFWLRDEWQHPVDKILDGIKHRLARCAGKYALEIIPFSGTVPASEAAGYDLPHQMDLDAVSEVLSGRLLFPEEIERAFVERQVNMDAGLECVLQVLFLSGELDFLPAITWQEGKLRCFRCGQTDNVKQAQCLSCGSYNCYYCEECLSMGESRLCKPLYGRKAVALPSEPEEAVTIQLSFKLTRAQKDSAATLKKFVCEERNKRCVVWAVCGAGKTEVTFWAVAETLKSGGRVLYVSPRKDVISELAPRFKSSFSAVEPLLLHGGTKERFSEGKLVFATTHQAIRLYSSFDLVILDEVDAYPYQGSGMLYHAVQRATKPAGKTIYLSATPDEEMLKDVAKGDIKLVRIPARHHGCPLPEPQFVIEKALSFDSDGEVNLPGVVQEIIHRSLEGDLAQLFIFVPSVFLARRVGENLQQLMGQPPFNDFAGEWVQYSHSKDPLREEKRLRFSRGDFPIFVTTTIMERGITVPRANVLVLFAEHERIFDAGSLVQMAGRSGRSSQYPDGRVWFVGSKITTAMKTAVEWIRSMNQEAYRLGYMKEEIYRDKEKGG